MKKRAINMKKHSLIPIFIIVMIMMIGCAPEVINNIGNDSSSTTSSSSITDNSSNIDDSSNTYDSYEIKTYEDVTEDGEFTIIYPISSLVNLNFEYPYKDPKGNDAILSGTISIPKVLYDATNDKEAWGIMLYNHYTVMRADQCPTKGALKEVSAIDIKTSLFGEIMPVGIENHKIITVSADYYGFGSTETATQYYCAGEYNARCSLEALKAAKEILTKLGYTWGDYLINVGYSQGGQTSMAVQKLVDTGEYDININATFAGAGPYSLTDTWQAYINAKDETSDNSVAIYPILAFNEYNNLDLTYSDIFQPTLLNHIDDWFLDKSYTLEEVDGFIKDAGMEKLTQVFTETMLDLSNDIPKRITAEFDTTDLTQGWTPKSTDRIYLFHSDNDKLVPPINTSKMVNHLTTNGLTLKELESQMFLLLAMGTMGSSTDLDRSPGVVCMRKPGDENVDHLKGGQYWMMDVISELKEQFKDKINPNNGD